MGDGDVDVDAVALWPRCVHLLEPERRADPRRVDEAGASGPLVDVAEHGEPERPDGLDVERVDRHLAGLRGERLAGQARHGGQLGDRPRQVDIGIRDGATGGMRRQCHVHAVGVADVDVGVVLGPLGGRCHVEGETGRQSNKPARNVASRRPSR